MNLKNDENRLSLPLYCEDIAIDLCNYPEPMDLDALFPNRGSIELEIGSGRGIFLLNESGLHPEINYIGIEWAREFYLDTVKKMRRGNRSNVRVLRADGGDFIRHFVNDQAISVFHLYFPDPWPKNKHHKRRFVQQENMLEVHRILMAGGQVRLATDHAGYAGHMRKVMLKDEKVAPLFDEIVFNPSDAAAEGELVGSNFEKKYINAGRQFFTMAFRKKS